MGSQVKGWFMGQGANPGDRQRGESCTIPPQGAQDDTVPCCLPTLSRGCNPFCLQFTDQGRLFGRKKAERIKSEKKPPRKELRSTET